MKRTPVPSPDLWGWPETDVVECVRITPRGDPRSVDKVYLNDEFVGFVVGRVENRHTGTKAWDYVAGDSRTPTPIPSAHLSFCHPSRQHALVALVENRKRATAPRVDSPESPPDVWTMSLGRESTDPGCAGR